MGEFYTFAKMGRNSEVTLMGYENGQKFVRKEFFTPRLWYPAVGKKEQCSKFKTMFGEPLVEKSFEMSKELKSFEQDLSETGSPVYYFRRSLYQFLIEKYTKSIDIDYSLIRVMYLDIESECEDGYPDVSEPNEIINAITIAMGDQVVCFGLENIEVDPTKYGLSSTFTYYAFEDEYNLLKAFVEMVAEWEPDIVTGWNIEFFDIPYIIARGKKVLGDVLIKKLSPIGQLDLREIEKFGRTQIAGEIIGIATLDYIDLYKKFSGKNQPSHKLGYITSVELGDTKLEDDDPTPMHLRYKTNYPQFIHYNVKDVLLVMALNKKLGLIDQAQALAYQSFVMFGDVMSQVKTWEVYIARFLYDLNVVMPVSNPNAGHREEIDGAYVMPPKIGAMQKWTSSFDLDGLYPNIQRMFNISPEKLVYDDAEYKDVLETADSEISREILAGGQGMTPLKIATTKLRPLSKDQPYSLAYNNMLFRNNGPGYFPLIIKDLMTKRKAAKKKMLDAKKLKEEIKKELQSRGISV